MTSIAIMNKSPDELVMYFNTTGVMITLKYIFFKRKGALVWVVKILAS